MRFIGGSQSVSPGRGPAGLHFGAITREEGFNFTEAFEVFG